MKKIKREGIVYSTDKQFMEELYQQLHEQPEIETLPPDKQKLKVILDLKTKPGKKITRIEGFIGNENDLEQLAKTLKSQLGIGGSTQEGSILLQGDVVQKATRKLQELGYVFKKK